MPTNRFFRNSIFNIAKTIQQNTTSQSPPVRRWPEKVTAIFAVLGIFCSAFAIWETKHEFEANYVQTEGSLKLNRDALMQAVVEFKYQVRKDSIDRKGDSIENAQRYAEFNEQIKLSKLQIDAMRDQLAEQQRANHPYLQFSYQVLEQNEMVIIEVTIKNLGNLPAKITTLPYAISHRYKTLSSEEYSLNTTILKGSFADFRIRISYKDLLEQPIYFSLVFYYSLPDNTIKCMEEYRRFILQHDGNIIFVPVQNGEEPYIREMFIRDHEFLDSNRKKRLRLDLRDSQTKMN